MRRLLTLVAAVLLIAPAAAQERAKNMLSVRGGATFAHLQVTLGSLRAATETRTGYHIEVADEVLLHRSLPLYVETGIGFTSAGGAYRGLAIRPMYLQVPLLLNVRIRLGRRLDLIPAAGAWYAVGLGGKIRSSGAWYDLFGPHGALRRSDFGIRLALGVEWRRIQLRAGCDVGCLNTLSEEYTLPSDPDGDLTKFRFDGFRSRNLSVGIGYRF